MSAPTYVDGFLADWGSSFFNQGPVQRAKAKRGLRGVFVTPKAKRNGGGAFGATSAAATRLKLGGIAKKTPEVIVKISGGGKGMKQIKDHLDYITRNGRLDGEDQDQNTVRGRDSLAELRDEWQQGQYPVEHESGQREAFNIVLSMPAGTDALGVKRAARDFAAREFEGHQYAMVLHTFDTDPDPKPSKHPHVHLCVKAQADDGTRLNPRKADLQRWREGFAQALREHGIEAAATKRVQRLEKDRADSQAVHHRKQRGAEPEPERGAPQASDPKRRPNHSPNRNPDAAARMAASHRHVLQAYHAVSTALAKSPLPADQQLVLKLIDRLAEATQRPPHRAGPQLEPHRQRQADRDPPGHER